MSEPIDPPDPYPIVRVTEPVDRIQQLAEQMKKCNPFHMVQLPAGLLEEYINEARRMDPPTLPRRLAV